MAKEKEVKNWCIYCKNAIFFGEAYTIGTDGKLYHPECYNQINTFTEDFEGTYHTDEFGENLE